MPTKDVLIPDIGDFDSVDVIEVLVAPGDRVKAEDSLITLESEKATMEIPSPWAGVVKDIRIAVGDKVAQGSPVLTLETEAEASAPEAEEAPAEEEVKPSEVAEEATRAAGTAAAGEKPAGAEEAPPEASGKESARGRESDRPSGTPPAAKPPAPGLTPGELAEAAAGKPHASPAIRRFARELGVDLGRVRGTGPKGRIQKEDVQAFVKEATRQATPAGTLSLPEPPAVDFARFGEIEKRALSRIQKISGASLHRNWLSIPHVTQFDEADITELEAFRKSQLEELAARNIKLTLLAFLTRAVVAVLKQFPQVNASLDPDGEHLIIKKYYHIGVAVDTPEGLVVPVIRDADRKGLVEIAHELGELSTRAREKQLAPNEMQGGTFTISSLGGLGGSGFTPIINAPEVAILGVARAVMQPVYHDGDFVPRLILPFSLSYDHRVVDGADAVRFTSRLSADLSDVRRILL
jgi:pyruvate dehydrogenase E2 component (dihydrolipoyllysine-residue acetyltransferase)